MESYIAERIERDLEPEMERVQVAMQSDDPAVQQQAQFDRAKLQEKLDKRVLSVLHKNGITDYGKMRQTFQAGMVSARADGAGPSAKIAYQLYKQAVKVAGKSFAQRLAGNTSDFYEAITVASREIFGDNEEEAVALAHRITTQPDTLKWYTDLKYRHERESLIRAARDKMEEGRGFFFSIEGQDGYIMDEVAKYAEFFAAGLLDKKQVIDLSLKQFAQSHTIVNGQIVKNADVNMSRPERSSGGLTLCNLPACGTAPQLGGGRGRKRPTCSSPKYAGPKLFEFISKRTSFGIGSSNPLPDIYGSGKEVSVPVREWIDGTWTC